MKNTLILFFFVATLSFSQNSGKVLYIINTIDFVPKEKNTEIEILIENAKNQTFTLKFNNNINSVFKFNDVISENENKSNDFYQKMASIRFTCDFVYFLDNIKKIEFFQKNNGALIKSEYELKKWEITTESKKIDEYLCYKAIYKYDYTARDNKIKTRVITAWFAPSLPYSFGPKNYNGLPGLILELNEWNTTYLASKIELFNENIKIDMPNGKSISQREYEQKSLSDK